MRMVHCTLMNLRQRGLAQGLEREVYSRRELDSANYLSERGSGFSYGASRKHSPASTLAWVL